VPGPAWIRAIPSKPGYRHRSNADCGIALPGAGYAPPCGESPATSDCSGRTAAAGEAEDLGYGLDALWTGLDLGAALAGTDREEATRVLTRVAQAAGDRGAVTVRELAGRRLRALGVRTWRRGPGRGGLTDREQVIARLIAAGASNPEIADRLYLSRKTVERHVSNVLRKAGVRNRAELAARAAEFEGEGVHR